MLDAVNGEPEETPEDESERGVDKDLSDDDADTQDPAARLAKLREQEENLYATSAKISKPGKKTAKAAKEEVTKAEAQPADPEDDESESTHTPGPAASRSNSSTPSALTNRGKRPRPSQTSAGEDGSAKKPKEEIKSLQCRTNFVHVEPDHLDGFLEAPDDHPHKAEWNKKGTALKPAWLPWF